MANGDTQSTFDKLVAGISIDERKALLERLKNISAGTAVQEFHSEKQEEILEPMSAKLKKESIFYYFILLLRSFLLHKKVETIYNDDLIGYLARKINSASPGTIDNQKKILRNIFCGNIKQMKICADFFRPYVSTVSDYPGEFYVFLSAFVAPEISEDIKKESDPYTIPFTRELTSDLRLSKIRSLEAVLKNISPPSRAVIYDAAKRVEWLSQFVQLPYTHFTAQFNQGSGDSYNCNFEDAKMDFPSFARVLDSASSVSSDILQALFLFTKKKNTTAFGSGTATEDELKNFVSEASLRFKLINAFVSQVSFQDVGRVIFHSYNWQCERFGGAEDWFTKFHDEWKRIFDTRWESWLRDKKKAQLASLLKTYFKIEEFPDLPHRPWAHLWDGVQFGSELTGGFLVWFCKNKMPETFGALHTLQIEGSFINTENRTELSDILANFNSIAARLNQFDEAFSPSGTYGSVFEKFIGENLRTLQAQSQVDSMIFAGEAQIHEANKKFCDNCRALEKILRGIFDDKKTNEYAGLQNFTTIQGHDNLEYREKLMEVRVLFAHAQSLLSEVEPIDLPRYSARA